MLLNAAQAYDEQLRRLELLPSDEAIGRRGTRFLIGAGILFSVSAIKFVVALQRGRRNVGFLIVLTILAMIAAWIVTHPRMTETGRRLLRDLRVLFDGVKARAAVLVPGGGSVELPILAAVFGLTALPDGTFPHVKKLFPKSTTGPHSSGSTCGAGCGSSSGGGGCGGGGGGCGGGGCGGCGS